MTNHCPVCNKAVDPLRSRFVAVRSGKVVAYCSAECAQSQGVERPPVRSPATPASGVPTALPTPPDRKSTCLNSSHHDISYAVFCLDRKSVV